jgi:ATP-binding cassette subfamily F protein uup
MVKPKFDLRDSTERDRMYQKFSDEQLAFYHAIQDKLFIGCNACAGSGKTLVSLHCAIELLSQSKVSRVIYVRVPSDRDKKLGYLPGTLEEKCSILWAPAYDALMTLGIQKEAIEQLEEEHEKWNLESNAKSMMTRLGIYNFDEPVGHLSGGQRKRLALVAVLLTPCDVLLLDEPTNHLDAEMAEWLENYLKNYRGAMVMVTHDRI